MTNPYKQPCEYVSTTTNWFNPNGVAHYARPVPQLDIYHATNNTLNRIIAGEPARVAGVDALFDEKRVRDEARRREVAEAAAKVAEEKRAQEFAAAIEQQKEEESAAMDRNRRAKYKVEMNQEAEDEAAAATAAARQIQELRRWRDYCFQRYVDGHEQTAAERQEEKERKERLHVIRSRLDHEMKLADCHLQFEKWGLQRNAQMDSKAAFDAWHPVDKPRHARSQWWNAGGRQAPLPPSLPAPEPEACCDFDYCYSFCADIVPP